MQQKLQLGLTSVQPPNQTYSFAATQSFQKPSQKHKNNIKSTKTQKQHKH